MSRPLRRVVLVDDHEIFRAGLRAGLDRTIDVVGEAGTIEAAVPLIIETEPDVVLLDVHLPDGGGQTVIGAVHNARPAVRFLALSVSDAAEDVVQAIRAGARGYVTKTISPGDLIDAVHRVADGDAVFGPWLAGFVLDAFGGAMPGAAASASNDLPARAGASASSNPELDQLTPREQEVLLLIARGYTYKEVAARLVVSVKTIESHVSSVLRKLQLSNRNELTRWAATRRMI